ncbi:MAG: GAF domain-containing protein [Pyrinomonadaceae bacterium]|nr:GAF domain-containing protein [Pyrinomonadaceae bacterium]
MQTVNSSFMSESLEFTKNADRATRYAEIAPQIESLLSGETDVTANLANVAAVLKQAFDFFWVGFYIVKGGELVLGPFQGPIACTRIRPDQGVCGHAYTTRETVIVPDVDKFPGHIACASESRSEIVLPVFAKNGDVFGVLDVDSAQLNDFSDIDRFGLERIVRSIEAAL